MGSLEEGFALFRGLIVLGIGAGLVMVYFFFAMMVGAEYMIGQEEMPGWLESGFYFAIGVMVVGPLWFWGLRPIIFTLRSDR